MVAPVGVVLESEYAPVPPKAISSTPKSPEASLPVGRCQPAGQMSPGEVKLLPYEEPFLP